MLNKHVRLQTYDQCVFQQPPSMSTASPAPGADEEDQRPLTDFAHKWLSSKDYRWHQPEVNYLVQHSGLTPRDRVFGQFPLTPLSHQKEQEFLQYQKWYFYNLTSRDLFDLHVIDWPNVPDAALKNEIHPVLYVRILQQVQWKDRVWESVLPSLRLLSQFLSNLSICDWFDALLGGPIEEVTDVEVVTAGTQFEGVPFYRFRRRTAQERYSKPMDFEKPLQGTELCMCSTLLDADAQIIPFGADHSQASWTEKDVVLGLRGEIKHAYPGFLDELTKLPDSEKEFLEGKNFNSAIRKLRENGYFLPPWRQEPFLRTRRLRNWGTRWKGLCSGDK